ncbi:MULTISPECIES: AzlD family protein [Shinella]|uniref:AzlD family protein n=1 Tax=Shinella lacus TaxID=2654216 RepID=A0ABT1R6E8_9HYPH|nr:MULTISPECIES: AzlD family protein [Shinella]MCQ4630745.1 AzlD family protein [Shinella lacus]MDX3975672.1 AzlD family protein [Shinella sp.]
METFFHTQTLLIIAAGAIATYLTRIGGYVFITRMKRIPPRVEAALNAVPAAVLTTLVAPAAVTGGLDVSLTLLVALVVGLRLSVLPMLAIGWIVVMTLRHVIG